MRPPARVAADEALARLQQGNRRFVDGDRSIDTYLGHTRLDEHLAGQTPYAVVLGCSDSRVPVEIIFDAGLGDIFVIRVAGNIVAPSLIGSIEFAAEKFGSRLVVVLGHSGCGAIAATVDALDQPDTGELQHINSIVGRIRPSLAGLLSEAPGMDRDEMKRRAVRLNVSASANMLRHGSATLERLMLEDGLLIVGAEYSLESGRVEFFDGVPAVGTTGGVP